MKNMKIHSNQSKPSYAFLCDYRENKPIRSQNDGSTIFYEALPQIINWLNSVEKVLQFSSETYFLTLSLMEKCLSGEDATNADLTLTLACSLWISYKYHDYTNKKMTVQFVKKSMLKEKKSVKEILAKEISILKTVNFNLQIKSYFYFSCYFFNDCTNLIDDYQKFLNAFINVNKFFVNLYEEFQNNYPLDIAYLIFNVCLLVYQRKESVQGTFLEVTNLIADKYCKYLRKEFSQTLVEKIYKAYQMLSK